VRQNPGVAPSPDRDIRLLFPLPLATIASQASMASIPPLFVGISESFDTTIGSVGQVRSISALTAVLSTLLVGGWLHKHGARPVMLVGGLLGAAGAALSGLAPSLLVFGFAQAITGVGICFLLSSGFAGAGEFFAPEARDWAIGWVVALQSLAWIVGVPIVGVLAEAFSWHYGFIVPAAFCLIAAATALVFAPKLDPHMRAADERTGLLAALADRGARRWTIGELLAFGVWTAEITYIAAFYSKEFNLSEALVGVLLPLGSLAFMVGSTTAARVADRFSKRSLLVASTLAMGSIALALFNFHPFLLITLALAIGMGIAAGLRAVGSSTLALDQLPGKPGAMMAARTGATQIGYLVGASVGGVILNQSGFGALGAFMVVGMAVSAVVMAGVPQRNSGGSGELNQV
jgi:predicted MFS family arabinose efflux permease